jgi:spermidine/putrescine transport system ATP-binding protein
VDLSIAPGEFYSLLGPSGCGKTTLLRIVAGLELPDEGMVRIDGADLSAAPAHRRPVNTVFQSYALFPHLDVQDNVAFGLRMKARPPAEIAQRVRQALDLVQITALAARRPAELSGGQKQRVALARALVNEPRVLLLDEPLGALDLQLRRHLQGELRALQRRLGITFIHVTHDQEEALALSDRIAVMSAGRIEQVGDARTLYERPSTRFVAGFLGSCNLIELDALTEIAAGCEAASALGPLLIANRPEVDRSEAKPRWMAMIRPEHILMAPCPAPPQVNGLRGRVASVAYTGAQTRFQVQVADQTLEIVQSNAGPTVGGLQPGCEVMITLPPESLRILPY